MVSHLITEIPQPVLFQLVNTRRHILLPSWQMDDTLKRGIFEKVWKSSGNFEDDNVVIKSKYFSKFKCYLKVLPVLFTYYWLIFATQQKSLSDWAPNAQCIFLSTLRDHFWWLRPLLMGFKGNTGDWTGLAVCKASTLSAILFLWVFFIFY